MCLELEFRTMVLNNGSKLEYRTRVLNNGSKQWF